MLQSGLVAATVTSFSIDSYKWLQQDSGDIHTQLLVHISAQLANSTLPPAAIPTFQPSASAIRINAFWFASLMLSLSVALIGMVTKGWLCNYLNTPRFSSQENTQNYEYRYYSLLKRNIPSIVPWLPMLLQVSLLCFLFGLLDLVLSLNRTVAAVAAAAMAISFLFLVVTTLNIMFIDDYPSPSPYGAILTQIIALFFGSIHYVYTLPFKEYREYRRLSISLLFRVWVLGETVEITRKSESIENHVLIKAAVADDDFLDLVQIRMRDISNNAALHCMYQILLHRWAWLGATDATTYIIKQVAMVMGLTKDVLFRDPTGCDVHQVMDLVRLLVEGWCNLPIQGPAAHQEAEPLYQEIFLLLADLLSVYGEGVQSEVLCGIERMYERSSASANNSGKCYASSPPYVSDVVPSPHTPYLVTEQHV